MASIMMAPYTVFAAGKLNRHGFSSGGMRLPFRQALRQGNPHRLARLVTT